MANFAALLYLVSSVLFILALRGLTAPDSSRQGARYGVAGMAIAIFATLVHGGPSGFSGWLLTILGIGLGGAAGVSVAGRVELTKAPLLVALFHGLIGLAVVLVAAGALYAPHALGIGAPGAIHRSSLFEMALAVAIGAITFTGSIIAFAKLDGRMSAAPILLPQRQRLNVALAGLLALLVIVFVTSESHFAFLLLALVAFALGAALVVPIGGADMPVVVSILNSCSGWAVASVGFALGNLALIVTGALVGASGATLAGISGRAAGRSLVSIILGGFGAEEVAAETRPVNRGSAEDAAYIMRNAASVIIVPGYGMAAAQAQHALREMADLLKKAGVHVRYAVHPAAGRTPGQIRDLLAEARTPVEDMFEPADINPEFALTDVALVVGANDVANPAAAADPKSALHGMPVLDVEKAKTIMVIKRGMGPGQAGVENELFFRDNTTMLFGDARKITETIVESLGR